MATETIREYVTSLGWKVDDGGERRFYAAIEGATLRANLLATALEEMAATAANKIGAVSTQFEALYNQAQRLGTSGPSIRAFEFAVRQVHGSVEGANAALNSFGEFLKNLPPQAAENLAKQLRIPIDDTKDKAKFLLDIYERLSHMPKYLANQFRETYHLGSWSDFQQVIGNPQGAMKAYNEEIGRQNAAGITDDAMRKQGELATKFLELSQKIDDYSRQAELNLSHYGIAMLDILNKYIDEHQKKITEFVDWASKFGFVSDMSKTTVHFDEAKFAEHFETALKAAESSTALELKHFEDAMRPVVTWFERFGRLLSGWFTTPQVPLDQQPQPVPPGGDVGALFGSVWGGVKRFFGFGGGSGNYNYQDVPNAGNLTKLITQVSKEAGIDPRIMEGIRAGESGHGGKYDVNNNPATGDLSYGPFQLNKLHPGDLGSVFERSTAEERKRLGFGGLEDPRTIPMQARFVAQYIKRTGNVAPWAGFHGLRDADPRWGDAGYVPPADTAPIAHVPHWGPWHAGGSPTGPIVPDQSGTSPTRPLISDWSNNAAPAWAAINAALPVGPSSVDNSSRNVSSNVTNNITVNSPDPQSAASMVGVHLDRTANDVSRNLQGAFQ